MITVTPATPSGDGQSFGNAIEFHVSLNAEAAKVLSPAVISGTCVVIDDLNPSAVWTFGAAPTGAGDLWAAAVPDGTLTPNNPYTVVALVVATKVVAGAKVLTDSGSGAWNGCPFSGT